jgi:hypothetical protein
VLARWNTSWLVVAVGVVVINQDQTLVQVVEQGDLELEQGYR